MDTQLDLSIAAAIKDPALRASLERLGAVINDKQQRSEPAPPSSAQIIQFPAAAPHVAATPVEQLGLF